MFGTAHPTSVFGLASNFASDSKHRLYITNVPRERLSPEDISRVYAASWEVELHFKELKSGYKLDQLPSSKQHVVEALI